ncbi:MAG: sensor histidine kinase [Sedimentibacter sp.]
MSEIRQLCFKYTNLTKKDIEILENIAKTIQFIADSTGCDVFIDSPTPHNDEAIVIAEAKPSNNASLYKEKVVGKLALRQNEPAVLRAIDVGRSGRNIKGITQEDIKVKQSVEPIMNNEGKVIGILIIEQDVTEDLENNRRIEILAEANEELTTQIAEKYGSDSYITYYVNDAILIYDEDGVLKFKNPEADLLYKRFGYNEDILGMSYSNLSVTNKPFEEIVSDKSIEVVDVEVAGMCLQIKHIVQKNTDLKLVVIINDVTDVKQKEKELILKSVAIKEIHHRVKNNLQTIASLLRLQSRRIDSKEFHDAMNESINRILSIAVTHEILAKEGIDEVNIKEVINSIKYSMVGFEKEDNVNLSINVLGDDIRLSSDNATSIALVVNELTQNSVKHAYQGKNKREKEEITIIVEQGSTYSSVTIVDNGVGFDVDKIPKNSLGLMIVRSIVHDKLEGNLSIYSNSEGTKVMFDFKN